MKQTISLLDLQMLMGAALGLTEEQTEDIINRDETDLDDQFYEKFDVDTEAFGNLVEALLPLTPMIQSPLTQQLYHAFVRPIGNGNMQAIIKKAAQ